MSRGDDATPDNSAQQAAGKCLEPETNQAREPWEKGVQPHFLSPVQHSECGHCLFQRLVRPISGIFRFECNICKYGLFATPVRCDYNEKRCSCTAEWTSHWLSCTDPVLAPLLFPPHPPSAKSFTFKDVVSNLHHVVST